MAIPILATKLYIPQPRPKVVLRPHLSERLNEGLSPGRKLTLVSAAAGFGKTTLVSEWVAGCGRPVAWLSLDEGDNDPPRFLAYLIAALQTLPLSDGEGLSARIGAGMLRMLESPQPPPTEALLTALLNEIAAVPEHFLLVLDDYHVIEAQAVDQALSFLVEHLPPVMHLVIATREDPQLPLARLRARGQLTELRAADLRFTPAEAAQFLNQVMGLNLAAADIAALEARTEGWIAGLQMAALSLQGRADTAGFIQAFTGSHRFVLDYLVEEVLQHQPERIRSFLLQTAMLDRLSGPLCDAVTGQKDSREMLDILERGNLFIVPLDDQRQWVRYHHLFAEVLQVRLLEAQPSQASTLHRRASAWYERNGLPADAIRHALAAQDFEGAADLIELAWTTTEDGSLSTKWLGWAKALPDELIRTRPVLSVWYAHALLGSGEMEAAEARLADAERWLEPADNMNERPEDSAVGTCPERSRRMVVVDEEQFRSLPASIAIARAYCAQTLGDVHGTVTYAQRALDLTPEANHFRRGQATALLGLTYWASGDLEAANRTFADYTMKLRAAGNIIDAIGTTFVLADIRMALGRLHEAVSTLKQSLQFVMEQGEPMPPDAADLYRGLGELHRERGDLEAAAQYLLKSKELRRQAELSDWQRRLCVTQARMKQTQGDLDGALDLLNEAERLFIRTPLPDVRPISALKARIWVAQGRLIEAQGWAREQGLSVDDVPSYLREFEHVTLARVLITRHRSDRGPGSIYEAIGLLERLLKAAEEGGRMGSVIEILALLALAHAAQGAIPLALVSLERAVTLAAPEGYVRLFVDEGAPMAQLLSEAAARGMMPDYSGKLLAAFEAEAQTGKDKPHLPLAQPLIEPLSQRELKVLQLIAQGLSNREIGERLFLALSTVKGHNQKIFDKLQVQSRTEAIARARELGLLAA